MLRFAAEHPPTPQPSRVPDRMHLPHDRVTAPLGRGVSAVHGMGWAVVENGKVLRRASGHTCRLHHDGPKALVDAVRAPVKTRNNVDAGPIRVAKILRAWRLLMARLCCATASFKAVLA